MCIVRQSDLSSDDLAVLSGNSDLVHADDNAVPGLVLHDIPEHGFPSDPVCLSQIVQKASHRELVPA